MQRFSQKDSYVELENESKRLEAKLSLSLKEQEQFLTIIKQLAEQKFDLAARDKIAENSVAIRACPISGAGLAVLGILFFIIGCMVCSKEKIQDVTALELLILLILGSVYRPVMSRLKLREERNILKQEEALSKFVPSEIQKRLNDLVDHYQALENEDTKPVHVPKSKNGMEFNSRIHCTLTKINKLQQKVSSLQNELRFFGLPPAVGQIVAEYAYQTHHSKKS